MNKNLIGYYTNGNTIVEIHKDGTKIRYVPDDAPALPVYPESIDMKISNRCDIGCPICHEQSVNNGKLGDLSSKLVDSLRPYTEVAIGGGDPFSHPDLPEFLVKLKKQNVIANITVHWKSFARNLELIQSLSDDELIHGIGISVNEVIPSKLIDKICLFPNAVVHSVLGVANASAIAQTAKRNLNILFLGYKTYGRGIKYRTKNSVDIQNKIEFVSNHIEELTEWYKAVCFDNLAVEQLELRHKIQPETFDKIYT